MAPRDSPALSHLQIGGQIMRGLATGDSATIIEGTVGVRGTRMVMAEGQQDRQQQSLGCEVQYGASDAAVKTVTHLNMIAVLKL